MILIFITHFIVEFQCFVWYNQKIIKSISTYRSGDMENLKYLRLLAKEFPNIQATATEIINLKAICNLPKGTEHFISDIHGEYEPFLHMLRSASGEIRRKIDLTFSGTLSESERRTLATLIYYPKEKLELIKRERADIENWYRQVLSWLIEVCKAVSAKYTRSKVRKALPADFAYIIDELLHADSGEHKENYYTQIISSIIDLGRADAFIIAISNVIQRLAIDHLHVLGDIYDRGPRADIIMDELCKYHSVDVQWGNHDIVWMGAAAGSEICVANALRIALRYNGFDMIEAGYGINLRELIDFASAAYSDDDFDIFKPSSDYGTTGTPVEPRLAAKMHKAVSVIQFKLEGQLALRNPSLGLQHRRLLEKINFDDYTIEIDGVIHPLRSKDFPTVNPADPYGLSDEESALIKNLTYSFRHNPLLHKHVNFLFEKGSIYLEYNGNLLFHGCVPLTKEGEIASVELFGKTMKGKEYFDFCDDMTRKAFCLDDGSAEKQDALDFIWYLWCGEKSPLFGKSRMTTFERYYVADKTTHKEVKNSYFNLLDRVDVAEKILAEFGIDPEIGHVINGHVPVKVKKNENPVKAGGKLIVIDGGIAKPYQKETGIAGYTLIFNSHTLTLCAHNAFESVEKAIENEIDLNSERRNVGELKARKLVGDTNIGKMLKEQIAVLTDLLEAYKNDRI